MSSTAPRAGASHLRRRPHPAALVLVALAAGVGCDHGRGEVVVWLAGDVHLGEREPTGATDPAARLAAVTAALDGAGIVNLEGPVGDGPEQPPARLVNHPAGLAGLRRAGVVVVGVANNHARDGGGAAPARTVAAARAAGLIPAGLDAGPAVIDRAGVRVVVAAHQVGALPPAALTEALAAAGRRGDVLVASLHVTATPSYLPGPELVAAVEAAAAAGAAVVAVHGSHALARVERRGATVIAWGLGNLLFSCDCTDEVDGLVLEVALRRTGVVRADVVPIAAGVAGSPASLADDPALVFDLLASLGSSPLARRGARARL